VKKGRGEEVRTVETWEISPRSHGREKKSRPTERGKDCTERPSCSERKEGGKGPLNLIRRGGEELTSENWKKS